MFDLIESGEVSELKEDTPRSSGRRSDTIAEQSREFQQRDAVVPIPSWITLDSYEEELLWGVMTRARMPEDWRDFDLFYIGKIIKLETQIKLCDEQLRVEGETILNMRGEVRANPISAARRAYQKEQLDLGRFIGVHSTIGSTVKNMNIRGTVRREPSEKNNPVEDLLS